MSENSDSTSKLALPNPKEGSRSPSAERSSNDFKVTDLKKQRKTLKGRVTSFETYISKFQDSVITKCQSLELSLRISKMESLFEDFDNIQTNIEYLSDENNLTVNMEYRETFEEQYFRCLSIAKSIVDDSDNQTLNNKPVISDKNASLQFKLPDIKLPSFGGSYDDWLEFKNSYLTMIHKRTDLNAIHKFHYLRSSLTGSALQVISALEFTAENYAHAWDLLLNRFQNDRLLVHNHVKSLFSIPNMNKESPLLIRKMIDSILRNLRSLKSLGEPTESWDTLIMYIIVCKLDSSTEREWENHKGALVSGFQSQSPKRKLILDDLLTFLRNRADLLEMVNVNSNPNNSQSSSKSQNNNYSKNNNKSFHSSKTPVAHAQSLSYVATNTAKSAKRNRSCDMCRGNHALYMCSMFLNLSIEDRYKLVSDKNLCYNCLRGGHSISECYFGPCQHCKQKHNSLLHKNSNDDNSNSSTLHPEPKPSQVKSTVLHSSLGSQCNDGVRTDQLIPPPVLLPTALVEVIDDNNKRHTARALLDSGSQHCFVSDAFCKRINYTNFLQSTVQISGVGQSVTQSNKLCDLTIRSKVNDYYTNMRCYVLPGKITSFLPTVSIDVSSIQIPKHIQLADPNYNIPSEIDLLIGADIFWDLLNEDKIRLTTGSYLQDSKLGWVISGPIYTNKLPSRNCNIQCNFVQNVDNIDLQLNKFWELEDLSKVHTLSSSERKCEEIFLNTTKRELDGRFSVQMPLKESADSLGDSYTIAYKRFIALERKLDRTPEYKRMYSDFMREYRELGHMTKVDTYSCPYYFLPHHGVFREGSTTTKLRVVFDASCATTSGKSLNDIQYIGPKLQNEVFSVLLRFRQYRCVACADIEKAYRQTLVQPDQRNLLLILWREKASDPIEIYQLNTVTYGTASAPYLCIRCLHQVAQECDDAVVSRVIREDFFVDDLLTSHDDPKKLIDICEKTSHILSEYGYPLRKWTFNCDETVEAQSKDLAIGEHTQTKTLGLGWHNKRDEFHYTTKLNSVNTSLLTKRNMLSVVSQIYDPLGFLSPVVIVAKILLQKLWLCKLDWDDPVPNDVTVKFNDFVNSIKQHLYQITIPRFIRSIHTKHLELHIFSDASQEAYGACAFVRAIADDDSILVNLLCAKSKVAPLKTITIPKLELCGALLGARLYKMIIDSMSLTFDSIYFWTDSTIVIGWLRMSPHLLKTFVQNRCSEINDLTGDASWLHVESHNNPADLVSRGLNIKDIKNNNLWWHGPSYLHSSEWSPSEQSIPICENIPEIKSKTVSALCTNSETFIDFNRFSSFNRLIRTGAYLLRFIYNARNKLLRRRGPVSVAELAESQLMLSRFAQMQSFPLLYNCLLKGLPLNKCKEANQVLGLNVFLDDNKVIRVGGRLSNSPNFDYNKQHPILLCSKSRFAMLLFEHQHKILLHAGPKLILSTIRETWWPLAGRNLARKIVHQCIMCVRMKGKVPSPIMGNLPAERLEAGFPFMYTGVDYAGPVMILNRKGRGAKLIKGYICLFICFATRCIHLELVSSLSTADYILALKRFISRRGKPKEIFSDNGRNFVGAEKEFPTFLKENFNSIVDFAANEGIVFKYVIAYAPHFAGYWEAGVKSCKHHLRRILGNSNLTYEEFNTVLAQIEAVLNSRPISCLSTDPSDYLPLTPSHFLIGRPLTAPATADITEVPPTRLTRYDRIEQLRQHFWKRWATEYVSELQIRTKWKTHVNDLQLDSLVLLKDDQQPPLKWRLGRITQIFPGKDGIARVASIRTATGIVQRAFSKICPLPLPTRAEDTQ